jgi:hypothetical protein
VRPLVGGRRWYTSATFAASSASRADRRMLRQQTELVTLVDPGARILTERRAYGGSAPRRATAFRGGRQDHAEQDDARDERVHEPAVPRLASATPPAAKSTG